MVSQLSVIINRSFPDLYQEISRLPDYRKRPHYEVSELIVSGLLIFLFKQGSRNQADITAKNLDYQDNIRRFFGVRLADNDTVNLYLQHLDPARLEQIKQSMFRALVKSKKLQKYKFNGKYFMLAVDGTGLQSYDYEPYPGCPFKEYKSGKKVWTTYVLEAKIVGVNGFSLSLGTEWVENPQDRKFDKQDCEFKAFKRLSARLKKSFPRLPLLLLLDGLYPKDPIFNICRQNGWKNIITLKDKTLSSVQEQLSDKLRFNDFLTADRLSADKTHWFRENYKVFQAIDYKKHKLHVIDTEFETEHKKSGKKESVRFVHISDIEITADDARKISQAGRLRWKIENEGFNSQKNSGYNAGHKYSRTNFNATKNYYQLLQIADMINQLTYKSVRSARFRQKYGLTIKALIKDILSYLKVMEFDDNELIKDILETKTQLRY
jgi:hypothetical protein